MKTSKTEGIVIKRRNFGEADRILTVFTKRYGKIQIKAPGVRKITSRRSSHIELLNHSFFNLYHGKTMHLLTEIQSMNNFSVIKEDLRKIAYAYHVCELIDGLCAENQENIAVFALLEKTLLDLTNENDCKTLIRRFEIDLLTMLGFYKPSFNALTLDTTSFIENVLEKKLKTRQIMPRLI